MALCILPNGILLLKKLPTVLVTGLSSLFVCFFLLVLLVTMKAPIVSVKMVLCIVQSSIQNTFLILEKLPMVLDYISLSSSHPFVFPLFSCWFCF